ncbi:MAG: response regulator [Thermodesulfobacteriota bacterium]|nr:response regulator [Thermodesulfobacteriota bacterium]
METNNAILIVDDEERVLTSLARLMKREGYDVFTALSGEKGLEVLKKEDVGVVVSDLMMPEMDGIAFFENVARMDSDVTQILLTGHATLETALESINRLNVYGFLKKPWDNEELKAYIQRAFAHFNLIAENKRLSALTQQQNEALQSINETLEERVRNRTQLLDEAVRESILMLARAAEVKDDDAEGHIYRVLDMVMDLCKALELPDENVDRISLFSMVHDIGKIRVPDRILNKEPASLKTDEQDIRRQHTVFGEAMLGVKPFYKIAREIARSHHEHWDGTGYPDGLKGEEIPLPARIVAVADMYDTLTHSSPYKEAWDTERVLKEMADLAGKMLDPSVVEAFLDIQARKQRPAGKSSGTAA